MVDLTSRSKSVIDFIREIIDSRNSLSFTYDINHDDDSILFQIRFNEINMYIDYSFGIPEPYHLMIYKNKKLLHSSTTTQDNLRQRIKDLVE